MGTMREKNPLCPLTQEQFDAHECIIHSGKECNLPCYAQRDIAKDRELCTMATPGPWRWRGYTKSQTIELIAMVSRMPLVMDFVRWGFHNAEPRFRNSEWLMEKAHDIVVIDNETHGHFSSISNPDAEFIAAAREALPHYIDRAEAAEKRVAELEAQLTAFIELACRDCATTPQRCGRMNRCPAIPKPKQ